jgi:uncharacterized lipoprotein YbaY
MLVEGKSSPSADNVITSTTMTDPGDQPIEFTLSYAMASVEDGKPYRVYAGLTDGDLAWVTPIGVAVQVPQEPVIKDLEIPLEFRPDLLKGAVSGVIVADGLDAAGADDTYASALVIRVDTGETVGVQVIQPISTSPIEFAVPYDPRQIDPDADYVTRATMWDGTSMWSSGDEPVITNDSPKAGVVLTMTAAPTPSPPPEATPTAEPSPTPAPTPDPGGADSGGGFPWIPVLVVAALAVVGASAVIAWQRSRQEPPAA